MKLKNKKTGEVFDALIREKGGLGLYKHMVCDIKAYEHGGCIKAEALGEFNSLAGLNEEWEDYVPKEPLIKDEKIRKAVRAWAEAEGIEEVAVLCHTVWKGKMTEIAKPDDARLEITFRHDLGIKMGNYTITELCGEEL